MGPWSQTRRQFAFVRKTLGFSSLESFSSLSRSFKYSHDSKPSLWEQHLGLVWSAQRKICRWNSLIPNDLASFFSFFSKSLMGRIGGADCEFLCGESTLLRVR